MSEHGIYRLTPLALADGQQSRFSLTADGALRVAASGSGTAANQVQGTSAANAADDGTNPVKVAGVANSGAGLTTAADGQRQTVWVGPRGQVVIGTGVAAGIADGANTVTIPLSSDGLGRPTSSASMYWNGTQLFYARGDATGAYMVSKGTPTIATGQVAVTTSATQVVPARVGRQAVTVTSTSAVVFYVGATGVTVANGHYVAAAAGASITIPTAAAVFAIGASALTVSYLETY